MYKDLDFGYTFTGFTYAKTYQMVELKYMQFNMCYFIFP